MNRHRELVLNGNGLVKMENSSVHATLKKKVFDIFSYYPCEVYHFVNHHLNYLQFGLVLVRQMDVSETNCWDYTTNKRIGYYIWKVIICNLYLK